MLAGAYPGTGKNKVEIRNTLVKILTAGVNTFVCLQPTQEMKDRAHVYFDIAEKLVVENNRNKKSGGKVYGGGFPESITFVHMPFKGRREAVNCLLCHRYHCCSSFLSFFFLKHSYISVVLCPCMCSKMMLPV